MTSTVKRRSYRSEVRSAQADATRDAVLLAARELFTSEGYGCPIARIAERAGVAVDTIYTSVGRKPALVLAVIDMVLGDADRPLPAEQRDYVQRIRAADGALEKIAIYSSALARLLPVVAPLQEALRDASRTDPGCAQTWARLEERRAGNMLLFAQDLRATGEVRGDLADQQVADIVWSTNSSEYYSLLSRRGWSPERIGGHLAELWTRTLIAPAVWVSDVAAPPVRDARGPSG
ncbi:TetR/AcrR family transcriptional regulator [Pengzhenrongella frigida]|uniref:TetR/AcrR family transcriptional regulator n=1 Tax=Pengzhenrongella frigida TaxID=1259133 RepID=A0A4Q5N2B6_9MICO|nr:TetR/AcrR family transcriptional regulator [Cellulomonas sp. HLT2-17]RYV52279.1 TetR/AcrR family transcriptional regulator [Cellulomonas sp. HLT2-17]